MAVQLDVPPDPTDRKERLTMFRERTHILLASVFVLTLFTAVSASAQSGFAKIRANGTVATFGGSDTTTVGAVHSGVGQYTVTFTGAYLPTITADDVVINTTAESINFAVTNTFVSSANPNQIVVFVFAWVSSTLAFLDNPVFVTINVGSGPPAAAAKSGSSPQGVTPAAADKSGSGPQGATKAASHKQRT